MKKLTKAEAKFLAQSPDWYASKEAFEKDLRTIQDKFCRVECARCGGRLFTSKTNPYWKHARLEECVEELARLVRHL